MKGSGAFPEVVPLSLNVSAEPQHKKSLACLK